MTFSIQRVAGTNVTMQHVDGDVLRIGRGTNCELRSDNAAVALLHAEIRGDASGFTISDKGSATGTYVNRRAVETAGLATSDEITIGDLQIVVERADAGKLLVLRVSSLSAAAAVPIPARTSASQIAVPGAGEVRAKKIDFARAFSLRRPYLTKLTVSSILLIAIFSALIEILRPDRQTLMMPGNVSAAHRVARDANGNSIATNCEACHDAWHGVTNAKCTACHGRAPHAERQVENPRCSSCHIEHTGQPQLATIADTRCLSCHVDLQRHAKGGAPVVAAHIRGFGIEHPEFQPVADRDTLRFSHKKHLRGSGLADAEGKREVLRCSSCHRLVMNGRTLDPEPIDFKSHCQRCHRLTFDDDQPSAEVPHGGDPALVYGFVMASYAGKAAPQPPFQIADTVVNTTCRQCHKIEKRGQYRAAVAPVVPVVWMQHARFTHGPHRDIACERCHANAANTTKATDSLMPKQQDCTGCHGPQKIQVATTCATCHAYHERSKLLTAGVALLPTSGKGSPPPRSGEFRRTLQLLLTGVIVILALTVLIPVAIALFGYVRTKVARQPKPTAPTPPPLQQPVTPPAPPQPLPASKPEPATAITPLPSQTAPAATEVVQWYGMLRCTHGKLAGQRFVVTGEGFWIGRDAALSQVVIDDVRISKRHVQIAVKNGRVHAIDRESTNGTYVNGKRERITEVELQRGATIVLGDNVAAFVYEI